MRRRLESGMDDRSRRRAMERYSDGQLWRGAIVTGAMAVLGLCLFLFASLACNGLMLWSFILLSLASKLNRDFYREFHLRSESTGGGSDAGDDCHPSGSDG